MTTVWSDFARMVHNVEVEVQGPPGQEPPAQQYQPSGSSTRGGSVSYSSGGAPVGANAIMAAAQEAAGSENGMADDDDESFDVLPAPVQQRRVDEAEQIGRNDPCWCGSGKKFKKCHGQ
jgi:preprotein translocase subunit SecA